MGWGSDGNPTAVILVLPIPSHSHPIASSYSTCSHITDQSPLPSHLLPIPALAQLLPSQSRCQRSYSRPIVVLTLTRIIKSVVTGQAPVTLELRNTLRKNTNNPRWYTHMSQQTQFMPPPETYKSEIGSQSTMCQVHTGAYVSLLAPGKTDYTACHPRKTTTYILHVLIVSTRTPLRGRLTPPATLAQGKEECN